MNWTVCSFSSGHRGRSARRTRRARCRPSSLKCWARADRTASLTRSLLRLLWGKPGVSSTRTRRASSQPLRRVIPEMWQLWPRLQHVVTELGESRLSKSSLPSRLFPAALLPVWVLPRTTRLIVISLLPAIVCACSHKPVIKWRTNNVSCLRRQL